MIVVIGFVKISSFHCETKHVALTRRSDVTALEAQGIYKALVDVVRNGASITHKLTQKDVSTLLPLILAPLTTLRAFEREVRQLFEKTERVASPSICRDYSDDEWRLVILGVPLAIGPIGTI